MKPLAVKSTKALFEQPWLERLSRTHNPSVVLSYAIISISLFAYGLYQAEELGLEILFLLLAGFILFTLLEYLIHRFGYHSENYLDEGAWQYKVHGYHHEHPRDSDRLALPFLLAIVVAGLIFALCFYLMRAQAYYFFPGFLLGYALYLWVHYLVHTRPKPNNVFGILWTHHHLHHYKYQDKAYGVSSPFWDMVFGTMPPKYRGSSSRVGG